MDATTPNRPFRDRFKLGNNKVSGKITVPSEENAFLAMTTYLDKQNKLEKEYMTLYNPKPRGSLMSKSSSWSKLGRNSKKADRFENHNTNHELPSVIPRLDLMQMRRQDLIKKILPKIKSERKIKAQNWREKKNRVNKNMRNQVLL